MGEQSQNPVVRFGVFEARLSSGELAVDEKERHVDVRDPGFRIEAPDHQRADDGKHGVRLGAERGERRFENQAACGALWGHVGQRLFGDNSKFLFMPASQASR